MAGAVGRGMSPGRIKLGDDACYGDFSLGRAVGILFGVAFHVVRRFEGDATLAPEMPTLPLPCSPSPFLMAPSSFRGRTVGMCMCTAGTGALRPRLKEAGDERTGDLAASMKLLPIIGDLVGEVQPSRGT